MHARCRAVQPIENDFSVFFAMSQFNVQYMYMVNLGTVGSQRPT